MDAMSPLPDALATIKWTGIFPAKTYYPDPRTVRSLDRSIDVQNGLAIPRPFRAARHSVTVGQFTLFLKETGTEPHLLGWRSPRSPDHAAAGEIYCTEIIPFCHWLGERLRAAERIPQEWQVDLPCAEEWLLASEELFIRPEPADAIARSGPRPEPEASGFFREWHWTRHFEWTQPPFESDWGKIMQSLGQGIRLHREGRTLISSTPISGTWDTDLGFRVVCRAGLPAL